MDHRLAHWSRYHARKQAKRGKLCEIMQKLLDLSDESEEVFDKVLLDPKSSDTIQSEHELWKKFKLVPRVISVFDCNRFDS